MAKNVKVLVIFPDGFINCTFSDSATGHEVTIAIPPTPPNEDGSPHTEDDVLDYLADQWPDNEFVDRTSAAMTALVGTTRGITARVVQRDLDRNPQGQP